MRYLALAAAFASGVTMLGWSAARAQPTDLASMGCTEKALYLNGIVDENEQQAGEEERLKTMLIGAQAACLNGDETAFQEVAQILQEREWMTSTGDRVQ